MATFSVGFLGCKIDWEHRFGDNFPLYAQVSRGNLKLHLSEHHGDSSPGSTVFVLPRGGLMAGVSISGQQIQFRPLRG